jgi:hypothetical protein
MASDLILPWTCNLPSYGQNGLSVNVPNIVAPIAQGITVDFTQTTTSEIWWLVQKLKEIGWTPEQACYITNTAPSAPTFNLASDWPTPFNFSNFRAVSSSATQSRPWIMLSAPAPHDDYKLVIDFVTSGQRDSIYFWIITGPITNTPAINARPASPFKEYGKKFAFFETSTEAAKGPHRMHFHGVTTDSPGSAKGAFCFLESSNTGKFSSLMMFAPVQGAVSSDLNTWVFAMYSNANTVSSIYQESQSIVLGRSNADINPSTASVGGTSYACCVPYLTSSTGVFTYLFQTNPFNNRNLAGEYVEFPILLASTEQAETKGLLTDLTLAPTAVADGSVYPPAPVSDYKKTKMGAFWMPWTAPEGEAPKV